MRISLYHKCPSFPRGGLRLGFTGAEMFKLTGAYLPTKGELRVAVNLNPDGKTGTLTFNKDRGLMVRPQFNVAQNPNRYGNLSPIVTGEMTTPVLDVLNLAPHKQSISTCVTGVITGNVMTFMIPEDMISTKKMRTPGHHPKRANHNMDGAGDMSLTGGNLVDIIRNSIMLLNQGVAMAQQEGWEVSVTISDENIIKAKVVPKAFDL